MTLSSGVLPSSGVPSPLWLGLLEYVKCTSFVFPGVSCPIQASLFNTAEYSTIIYFPFSTPVIVFKSAVETAILLIPVSESFTDVIPKEDVISDLFVPALSSAT